MFQSIILSSPLILVLLSLALLPLLAPKYWMKYSIHSLFSLAGLSIILDSIYIPNSHQIIIHTLLHEYIPFIIMLFTLYTLSTGIKIQVNATPTTFANAVFLSIGSFFSSIIGTTGAAMLLIYPFLDFNRNREYKTHLVVFFIILIANIGGLMTPLGDPPLLLGYLNGIHFSWVVTHMPKYWGGYMFLSLLIFCIIDKYILSKSNPLPKLPIIKIQIKGAINITFLMVTIAILFFDFGSIHAFGINIETIYLKDIVLLILSGISLRLRPKRTDFTPFIEVVHTFLVIFIVIAPVLYLLEQNITDIHKYLLHLSGDISHLPQAFFGLCSLTSAFLDNAPSYMLFFKMSGFTPQELMTTSAPILTAISISSVAMGSLTYIGNAPNLMVLNVAKRERIEMPSFLNYFACATLLVIPISMVLLWLYQ